MSSANIQSIKFERNKHGLFSWLLSFLSILALAYALYLGNIVVHCAYLGKLQSKLSSRMSTETRLSEVLGAKDLSSLFLNNKGKPQIRLVKVAHLGDLILDDKLELATDFIHQIGFPHLNNGQQLESALTGLKDLRTKDKSPSPDSAKLQSKLKYLSSDRKKLLLALLQLVQPEHPLTSETKPLDPLSPPATYKSGILKDLPLIPGVPDAILSSSKLKQYLRNNILTSVARKKLTALSRQGKHINNKLRELRESALASKSKRDAAINSFRIKRAATLVMVHSALQEVSKPRISKSSMKIYSCARDVAKQFDWSLPVLHAKEV